MKPNGTRCRPQPPRLQREQGVRRLASGPVWCPRFSVSGRPNTLKRGQQTALGTVCLNMGLRLAFTLLEIMVVVAIMGIVMTVAIPSLYHQLHPDSMRKAV